MRLAVGALVTFASAASVLLAHEIATHKRIGDAAIVYLQAAYPNRPILLGSSATLQNALQIGAEHEDDGFGTNLFGVNPYGRFIFHFSPALSNNVPQLGNLSISANGCSSLNWSQSAPSPSGATGCVISCSSTLADLSQLCSSISTLSHTNTFRWDQDLTTDNTGAPTGTSATGFGYVVHLLEDLGSPPHARNDAHPCVVGSFYCDQFEKFNDNSIYPPFGDPQGLPGNVWAQFLTATIPQPGQMNQVISTAGFTTPTDFFNALQQYVSNNYYSNRTVFQGPGPLALFSDTNYFYGDCLIVSGIAVSQIAGTCQSVRNPADGQLYSVRKIAHKSALYWATCPNPQAAMLGTASEVNCDASKADIDQTIAREQFAELGPVIAQHVAAFIMFYSPALTVKVAGTGTGSVTSNPGTLNCTATNTPCSALLAETQQGAPSITLTATPVSTFAGWSGACSGSAASVTIAVNGDQTCTATFNGVNASGSWSGNSVWIPPAGPQTPFPISFYLTLHSDHSVTGTMTYYFSGPVTGTWSGADPKSASISLQGSVYGGPDTVTGALSQGGTVFSGQWEIVNNGTGNPSVANFTTTGSIN